ncbi:MAG TPA: response regulator [Pyrinomonadaceae bacterium]|nr:response regulator [Pyrinomonadaceae bacterium]
MSQEKCRVLFIDDHEDTSEMLTLLLGEEDYEIATAGSVQEALRLAITQSFDLYVLDKHLPDGSGLELCMKLNDLTPGVPCIFYTGDAYDIHRSEAMAAGAHAYVAKPDITGLIENVQRLLSQRECAAATT